ncbi:MAG: U32 family peptidase [Eubacterium sp.]|nr:U32 family peptidase [Eubacterium sp.]
MTDKRPEILAPCGNPAAFRAALFAGADAMYLAMDRFGARAYAGNFQQNELLQAIEEAHLHDRKIYLTLNTLLKNEEFNELPDALDPLYRAGLDAVLVQDFGVYRFLRERYPELPLHASTQMNLCSPEGARYAKRLGFTRVVPARELSISELAEIRETAGIEVEAFVHGAMCFCYSGRCYLSSFAGGRSGNRGRCAQPCREMYNGKYPLSMKDLCTLEDVPALMEAGIDSLKIEGRMKNEYYVAACVDAYRTMVEDVLQGVFTPERAGKYRERLTEVFHRGGFTRGYLNQYSGPDMLEEKTPGHTGVEIGTVKKAGDGMLRIRCSKDLGRGDSLEIRVSPDRSGSNKTKKEYKGQTEEDAVIKLTSSEDAVRGTEVILRAPRTREIKPGTPVLRVRNASLMAELEEKYLSNKPLIPADLTLSVITGEPIQLSACASGRSVTVSGPVVEPATGRPVTEESLREKIGTLSGTDFRPGTLEIRCDGTGFVPVSVIKSMRREAILMLREKLLESGKRELPMDSKAESVRNDAKYQAEGGPGHGISDTDNPWSMAPDKGRIIFAANMEQAKAALVSTPAAIVFDFGISGFLPEEIRSFRDTAGEKTRMLIGFPYIYRSHLAGRMEELLKLALELDGAYVNGIDSLARILEHTGGKKLSILFLGEALYRYNDRAALHFREEADKAADFLWLEEPYELSLTERKDIRIPEGAVRVTNLYGHRPMMLTVQRSDRRNPEILEGNRGQRLILLQNPEMCYNTILSGRPVLQDADDGDMTAIRFTVESGQEVSRILNSEQREGIRHRGLL